MLVIVSIKLTNVLLVVVQIAYSLREINLFLFYLRTGKHDNRTERFALSQLIDNFLCLQYINPGVDENQDKGWLFVLFQRRQQIKEVLLGGGSMIFFLSLLVRQRVYFCFLIPVKSRSIRGRKGIQITNFDGLVEFGENIKGKSLARRLYGSTKKDMSFKNFGHQHSCEIPIYFNIIFASQLNFYYRIFHLREGLSCLIKIIIICNYMYFIKQLSMEEGYAAEARQLNFVAFFLKFYANIFFESVANLRLVHIYLLFILSHFLSRNYYNIMDPPTDLYILKSNFVEFRNQNVTNYYDFVKELGRGAYGTVYKVKQKKIADGQWRAIKRIIKKSIRNPDSVHNQIRNLTQLDHPSILKVYEVFEDENSLFIVTDLCEGGQLFDKLQKVGSFSESNARQIFTQIVQAINYCHTQKIAHRDLKPENLLFLNSQSLNLKIIDFGLSFKYKNNMRDQLKQKNDTKLVGTSYYIAPEIIAGSYDQRCDIWSAGIILYILVSAVPPFDGANDKQIINSVRNGQYSFDIPEMRYISNECKDLIKKMLVPQSYRLTIQQIFEHPWMKKELSNSPSLSLNFKKMIEFGKFSKLKKITAHFIASKFSEKHIEQLGNLFKQVDLNHDGAISFQELNNALQAQKNHPSFQQLKQLMQTVDTDKNGMINYTEFIASSIEAAKMFTKENLERFFKSIDKDGNGIVDKAELKQVLQKNNFSELHGKQIEDIMKECDKNGDGRIDFNQFCYAMMK